MTNDIELMMQVKVKVWPSDTPSFERVWSMPSDTLDDKGAKALLASVLRQTGFHLRECVAELSIDSQVIVSIIQQVKLVRRVQVFPS